MKRLLTILFCALLSMSMHAQLDNEKSSTKIAAEESKDKKGNSVVKTPVKINPSKVNGLTVPEATSINKTKKEFSMFSNKKFANPGELYQKRINKHEKELQRISEEAFSHKNEVFTDQNLGKFRTKTVSLNLTFRDHGVEDGDYVAIILNDVMIEPRIMLTNSFKGLKVDLKEGKNTINFIALNQGFEGYNTAELKVYDGNGDIIVSKNWFLSSGFKSTVTFIKEK